MHYWLVPAGLGVLGLVVVVVMALSGPSDESLTLAPAEQSAGTQPALGPTSTPAGASGAVQGAGGVQGFPPAGTKSSNVLPPPRAGDSTADSLARGSSADSLARGSTGGVSPASGLPDGAGSASGLPDRTEFDKSGAPEDESSPSEANLLGGTNASPERRAGAPRPQFSTPLGPPSIAIPLVDARSPIVFAKSKPLAAVEREVFNLASGKRIGQTGTFPANSNLLHALSDDGKYYALGDKNEALIEVRLCSTGQRLRTLQFKKNAFSRLKFIGFGEPERLVSSASMKGDQWLQIWNLETGKQIKEFMTFDFEAEQAALSADGQYLAMANFDGLAVFDLKKSSNGKKGKFVKMELSAPVARGSLRSIKAPRFSPDGTELAASIDGMLVCFDGKGRIVFEHPAGAESSPLTRGQAIEWSPDGQGWLLEGRRFLDRGQARVIWTLDFGPLSHDDFARFLDRDRLLLSRGERGARQLADAALPTDMIQRTLNAYREADCYLGPTHPVRISIATGALLNDASAAEVSSSLKWMIDGRLRVEGLRVADDSGGGLRDAEAVIEVHYSEQTVQPPPPPAGLGGGIGGIGGRRLGRMGTMAGPAAVPQAYNAATAEIALRVKGDAKLWTTSVRAQASTSGNSQLGRSARDELYDGLRTRLRQTVFPYSVPKSPDLTMLPAVLKP